MGTVQRGMLSVSVVRILEASASQRFLIYGSFNPFFGVCPLLGGSVMRGSTVVPCA